jgi:hypothetical protein
VLSTTFTPGDTSNYAGASANTSINVTKAAPTLTFGQAPAIVIGGSGVLSATGGSSISAVSFSSTTPLTCSVSGTTVTGIAAGACTVAADQSADSNYSAAIRVTQTIQVGKLSQTITFAAPAALRVGDADVNLGASASSGLAVTYVSSNPAVATIVNNMLHAVGAGDATITASQAGNETYLAAASVSQTLTVTHTSAQPVVISAVSDGATTTESTQNISGKLADVANIASVTIDGVAVQINPDGSFSYPVQLLPGANTITILVTDKNGVTTTETRTITLDSTAPKLAVTSTPDSTISHQKPITVTGTIESLLGTVDPTMVVSYSINGSAPQTASLTGSTYSFDTTLADGMNTILISAVNGAGQKVEIKRTISYALPTFTIAITSPVADARLALNSYLLSGVVTENTTPVAVTITMDGHSYTPAVDTNGVFKQQLSFTDDKTYQISVTGIDQNSNSQTVSRNIIHAQPKAADGTSAAVPVTIVDALLGLQMSAGINKPSSNQLKRMDVAPMVNGISVGDGKVDIEDVIIILYMAVGLIQ